MASIDRHVTRDVIALDSMTPCREAARLMADRKVGSIAVREGGKIIGLVTERDLVGRVLARGDSGSMPIGEAMRTDLPSISARSSEHSCPLDPAFLPARAVFWTTCSESDEFALRAPSNDH